MAERDVFRIFKGPKKEAFLNAIDVVTKRYGGRIIWNDERDRLNYIGICHNSNVHTVRMESLSGNDYYLCLHVACMLECHWIEVRVEEGDHWDYTLSYGKKVLDNFSTRPEYWDDDIEFQDSRKGNVDLLAKVWNIDKSRIINYIVWWRNAIIHNGDDVNLQSVVTSAYATDEHSYGDIWQCIDFMEALGGRPQDVDNTEYHSLVMPDFPKNTEIYKGLDNGKEEEK